MRAIITNQYGGPEELIIKELPVPKPGPGEVLIEVKAFGLNRAEIYFRKGLWGQVANVSGIECVGVIAADPEERFKPGQKAVALVGGMGRTINGSYAEFTCVPVTNVVSIECDLPCEELAAIPESYATAWACLFDNLALADGQTVLIRGATSALGQAALNVAVHAGARILATTRNPDRVAQLKDLGAGEVLIERPDLSRQIRDRYPAGIDSVLDLIGVATVPDSLKAARRNGRICMAGFLGGGTALESFNPLLQMPSGVHLSFFASAFVFGTPEFPLREIPFQTLFDRVAAGVYRAKPVRVFTFDEIQSAHRLMESNQAGGKLVVTV